MRMARYILIFVVIVSGMIGWEVEPAWSYERLKTNKGVFQIWKKMPVEYVVDSAGLGNYFQTYPKQGAIGSEFPAIHNGFLTWASAQCPNGKVGLTLQSKGKVTDRKAGYDTTCQNCNTNLVIFIRDRKNWRHNQTSLAMTITTFNQDTGEIVDADMEINAVDYPLSTQTTKFEDMRWDIQSIITHEAGHFFGLGHSNLAEATMSATGSQKELRMRKLHDDDIKGICAIYPPQNTGVNVPTYREVSSDYALGCSSAPQLGAQEWPLWVFVLTLLFVIRLRLK